jgi:hypothetical protein
MDQQPGSSHHHQGVGHREPTQPLLFVATQRRREHQIQMLKECQDGLVVHHETACLGTSPLVDRALPTVRLLQLPSSGTQVDGDSIHSPSKADHDRQGDQDVLEPVAHACLLLSTRTKAHAVGGLGRPRFRPGVGRLPKVAIAERG